MRRECPKKLLDVLSWRLEWGPRARALQIRADKGLPTPAWDNRPLLAEDLEWVMEGFETLSRTRPAGGWGASPLGLDAIRAYLDLSGCHNSSARLLFLELVLALDGRFMQWSAEHGKHPRSNADDQGGLAAGESGPR